MGFGNQVKNAFWGIVIASVMVLSHFRRRSRSYGDPGFRSRSCNCSEHTI